jgi:hypothetical protein
MRALSLVTAVQRHCSRWPVHQRYFPPAGHSAHAAPTQSSMSVHHLLTHQGAAPITRQAPGASQPLLEAAHICCQAAQLVRLLLRLVRGAARGGAGLGAPQG